MRQSVVASFFNNKTGAWHDRQYYPKCEQCGLRFDRAMFKLGDLSSGRSAFKNVMLTLVCFTSPVPMVMPRWISDSVRVGRNRTHAALNAA